MTHGILSCLGCHCIIKPYAKVISTYNFLVFREKLNILTKNNLREVFDRAF